MRPIAKAKDGHYWVQGPPQSRVVASPWGRIVLVRSEKKKGTVTATVCGGKLKVTLNKLQQPSFLVRFRKGSAQVVTKDGVPSVVSTLKGREGKPTYRRVTHFVNWSNMTKMNYWHAGDLFAVGSSGGIHAARQAVDRCEGHGASGGD